MKSEESCHNYSFVSQIQHHRRNFRLLRKASRTRVKRRKTLWPLVGGNLYAISSSRSSRGRAHCWSPPSVWERCSQLSKPLLSSRTLLPPLISAMHKNDGKGEGRRETNYPLDGCLVRGLMINFLFFSIIYPLSKTFTSLTFQSYLIAPSVDGF